jgi:hypothetical protein
VLADRGALSNASKNRVLHFLSSVYKQSHTLIIWEYFQDDYSLHKAWAWGLAMKMHIYALTCSYSRTLLLV